MRSGLVAKVNAAFLILILPFFIRMWIEAVVWRIQRGPQMLGFSLIHAGAGIFTIPIMAGFLALFLYWIFVGVVVVLWLIPAVRRKMAGTLWVVLGGAATWAFDTVADYLQRELPFAVICLGALVLSALLGSFVLLAVLSLRKPRNVAGPDPDQPFPPPVRI